MDGRGRAEGTGAADPCPPLAPPMKIVKLYGQVDDI